MARFTSSNKVAVAASFNGIPVVGLGDAENAISFERSTEGSTLTIGVSSVTTHFNFDPSGTASIILRPDSVTIDIFEAFWQLQRTPGATLASISAFTAVGENIIATGVSLKEPGTIESGGPELQSRTYIFNCESIVVRT